MSTQEGMKVLISVMSQGLTMIGNIVLPAFTKDISGFGIRLVEMLNNPKLSTIIYGRVMESLILENVQVFPDSGVKNYSEEFIYLRREKIICAFQYEEKIRRQKPGYEAKTLGEKQYLKKERVMIFTKNGLRIEGDYFKGTEDLSQQSTKPFFTIANAELGHGSFGDDTLHTPFIVVNYDAVIAFWSMEKPKKIG